jgi:diguanylate cyclase (GGDEF)-like protein
VFTATGSGQPAQHHETGRLVTLYESGRTQVCRLQRPGESGTLIRKELLGPDATARARHETTILSRLAGVDGVAHLASGREVEAQAVITEDVDGRAMADVLRADGLDPGELPRLALGLARVIAAVHGAGVIHRDINPANILLSGAEHRPVLIDFDLATTFAELRPAFTHQREIVGTLPYLAPEATGRTALSVDHRADLYGIGATLYEVATGRPPFGDGDPLQLVRDILTLVPDPLMQVAPAVGQGLSDIVARLLEKEPGRRYQSAEGLVYDLRQLADAPDTPLRLGDRDFPIKLSPPSILVGRDSELELMRVALDDAANTGSRGVLVAGATGVGKSALIAQLRPMVTARGGWFVDGKFEQYRQDTATDAVLQALGGIARLLLAESETDLAAWRARIRERVGTNAGLLMAVLPEFATLLGDDRRAPAGDPVQADVRLRQAALDLLHAVSSPDRPIVLVVDDLQWASQSALSFIDAVQTDAELRGLLFVGAYRDNEVDATHPLAAMISRWERLGVAPAPLALENLARADQGALLAAMLRMPIAEARAVAEAIAERTRGNPYDTVELVNALRRDGALTLDETGWCWDPATLRRHVGSGDVIDLLKQRIDRLVPETRHLLETLACVGSEVRLDLLAAACGRPRADVQDDLAPALEDGLLVMDEADGRDSAALVRFRHDRVQQAAHDAVDADAHGALRLDIARRLAQAPHFRAEAAEQYLAIVDLVRDPDEQKLAGGFFESSALAAGELSNHATAERYLKAAIGLLSVPDISPDQDALVRLQIARHSALYSLGRLDEADAVYQSIDGGRADPLKLLDAACVQVCSLTNRVRPQEAIALGFTVLSQLGFAVPSGDVHAQLSQRIDAMYDWIAGVSVDEDLDRPEITDQLALAASHLISQLTSPAFFCDHQALHWLVTEGHRLWAEHGPSAALVPTIAHAGHTTMEFRKDHATGVSIMRHVLAVSEARNYQPETGHVRFLYSVIGGHWFGPLEDDIEQARLAREELVRGGNLQHACFAFLPLLSSMLDCGLSLDALSGEVATALAFAARTGNETASGRFVVYRQFVRSMRGETEEPGSLTDETFDEAEHEVRHGPNSMAVAYMHTYRALAAAVFGDTERLIQEADAVMPLVPFIVGSYPTALAHVLQGMALAQRARSAGPDERAQVLADLDECRAWLAQRAEDAPENFRHLLRLVEAERAWATNDFQGAAVAFDSGMRDVDVRQRPWHRALIAERAAMFNLERGLERLGQGLLAEAWRHYHAWGAAGKVSQLERAFPALRSLDATEGLGTGSSSGRAYSTSHARAYSTTPARSYSTTPARYSTTPARSQSTSMHTDNLDMRAILLASQSLSSETNLDRLHASVVDQVRAITGATAVRFLLYDDDADGWIIPAAGREGESSISVDVAAARGLLPLTAFRYVERTREPLLVADATRDDRLSRDPYLAGVDRCSLLVVPVATQGVVRAMLVMENRLSSGAFTADRLDAVMMIAGQLAVSISNALLYRVLENRVADRTNALQAANEQLKALSLTDPLTQLANRRRFADVLEDVWNHALDAHASTGIVMIDIDHFKLFNDHYGHPAGDACLQKVAMAVSDTVRHSTDLVCRYGGEEFAIILPEADRERASAVGERVRKAVAALGEPHVGSPSGRLTLSVGVAAVVPSAETTAEGLVQAADLALYQAKQHGRNITWAN